MLNDPRSSSHFPVHAPPVESPVRYRAKIDLVSPVTRRETFADEEECFLGISLENSNFARKKLTGIVEWISRRFPRCTVLVGDSIHRITLQTTRGLDPASALESARALGRKFVEEEGDVFEAFSGATAFSFVTCESIQETAEYTELRDQLERLFQSDTAFRASVESFGRDYHGKHSADTPSDELARRIAMSSQYFLEEFSIFGYLRRRGTRVMVYPGSFSTLAEIAAGLHPGAPDELKDISVVSLCLRGTR